MIIQKNCNIGTVLLLLFEMTDADNNTILNSTNHFQEPWKELDVENGDKRIDIFISENVVDISRRQTQAMVLDGTVLVNGRRVKKNFMVQTGDRILILNSPVPKKWNVKPSTLNNLDIIYSDPAFIVINKPSKIPSTAKNPDDTSSIASMITARFPECSGIGNTGDGGLIHRLDTETSGLLIAARDTKTYDIFLQMQKSSHIKKYYKALVHGSFDTPVIFDMPLDTNEKNRRKVTVNLKGNKSVTHILDAEQHGAYSLLNVLIYKGFRHQIRVHLANDGFPICGDTLYNSSAKEGLERLFLHAFSLEFYHPHTGKELKLSTELPKELILHLNS
ncbi:MAG: RluA family pseudouridine synthase [Deltaproteobacteria bacterium]|nr:RluA family pseudouridine synthase [Deltaproteobacteria bacterium]